MNGMTGFDKAAIHAAIDRVDKAYAKLLTVISDELQSQFVNKIAEVWKDPRAVEFFNHGGEKYSSGVKKVMSEIYLNADTDFRNIVQSINKAAETWAEELGTTYTSVYLQTQIATAIDTTNVEESFAGGKQGMVVPIVKNYIAVLDTIKSDASSAMDSAVSAVENCGFLDASGFQEKTLIEKLTELKEAINKVMETLSSNIQDAVSETGTEYEDLAGVINFSGK